MNKALAVALLDIRRLAFGLLSAALVAGLIPALASGLGVKVSVALILGWAFVLVGAVTGGTFGNDFSDGRSSFFFARPLGTGVLIAGRFAALLALTAGAFFSFMASYWLSTSDRAGWTPWVLTQTHDKVLLSAWAVSLFISLSAAARGRGVRVENGLRLMLLIPVRIGLSMGAFLLLFGLFADLILRAYRNDFRPIEYFILSWVAASFVASCLAMAGGRTERGRIQRFQGRVMAAHFALVSVVVAAAWIYVLHPGVDAIERVEGNSWGSPDGRTAYAVARVDRGDGTTFKPVFVVDIASGQAERLNADSYQGPWLSEDGGTMVWSEATPFFFRPLWRHMGGATTYRVKTSSGQITPLPMPNKLPDYTSVRDLSNFGAVDEVLPSPDGDVFAIEWDRHLTFTSRSRGELSDVDQRKDRANVARAINLREAVFRPSGELRAARVVRDTAGAQDLTFLDVDPKSGSMKTVASVPVEGPVRVQFDGAGARALLTSVTQPGRGAFISLVDLSGAASEARPTILVKDVFFPGAIFLADGRIAVSNGGSVGAWQKRTLAIFSPTGQPVLDIPLGSGTPPRLDREIFPGVLAVRTEMLKEDLSLIDTSTGAVIRRIPNMSSPAWFLRNTVPAGTPAARLLLSSDGKLYELPSVNAEPRLLLPPGRK